ncbi:MAG: hypothetical protein WAU58_12850 [Terriglobales bacterium]|jgi:hypothetical protein
MSSSPQIRTSIRVPRAHLEGNHPAVLRLPNGQNVGGNLQVISLTGGLVSLSSPVVEGSQVKMIFLTGTGAVLGGAEMLPPVKAGQQPFRFVALAPDDHRRIGVLVGKESIRKEFEQPWMDKLRAASAKQEEPRRWRPLVAAAVGALMISLAAAAYLLHFRVHTGLLKQIGF